MTGTKSGNAAACHDWKAEPLGFELHLTAMDEPLL